MTHTEGWYWGIVGKGGDLELLRRERGYWWQWNEDEAAREDEVRIIARVLPPLTADEVREVLSWLRHSSKYSDSPELASAIEKLQTLEEFPRDTSGNTYAVEPPVGVDRASSRRSSVAGLVTQIAFRDLPQPRVGLVSDELAAIEDEIDRAYAVPFPAREIAVLAVWCVRRVLEIGGAP